METQAEVTELLNLLDSNTLHVVKEVKSLIQDNLNTNKDAWLLYGIMDHYMATQSDSAMEILISVREPHDKHLFEKMNEYIKGSLKDRLNVLNLLGNIVNRQPPWLLKIVNQPVLSSLIKCLKNDTDVPILMTGVLIITCLLPVIPVSVAPYLDSIFESFHRLAALNTRKPGNTPEVYLVHLQVGVYALFHRLYGMYPCHFLSFLRAVYCKKEHQLVFDKTIQPMLERIKIHPQLITSNKESEVSKTRWRKMETHDIIVNCARISLDPAEGTQEDSQCPVFQPHQTRSRMSLESVYSRDTMASFHPISGRSSLEPAPELDSLMTKTLQLSNSYLWSPAVACGMSTPPARSPSSLSQSTSDVYVPVTLSPFLGSMTTPVNQGVNTTPYNTPVHTSTPGDESTRKTTVDSMPRKKSLVLSFSKGPHSKTPTPTIEPPSPMKRDFTNEPPLGAQPLRAQRILLFKESSADEEVQQDKSATTDNKGLETSSENSQARQEHIEIAQEAAEGSNSTKVEEIMGKSTESILSVKSLPLVIEKLSDHSPMQERNTDIDEEVCNINEQHPDDESHDHISANHELSSVSANQDNMTAEQVADFMKTVNRIRFNSLNIENMTYYKTAVEKAPKNIRSLSCPSLEDEDKVETLDSDESHQTHQGTINVTVATTADVTMTNISPTDTTITTNAQRSQSMFQKSSIPTIPARMARSMDAGHSKQLNQGRLFSYFGSHVSRQFPSTTSVYSDMQEDLSHVPESYEHLLPMAMPYTCITQCSMCADRSYVASHDTNSVHIGNRKYMVPKMTEDGSNKVIGNETSLYSTISPLELLDRHMALGRDVHDKQLSTIPLSSHNTINWTHFGGSPPSDEINILRGQNVLLHTQMMYERHKREMHAQRNRRLLRKIAQSAALEEQNIAQADQVQLQESEINRLRRTLELKQEEIRETGMANMRDLLEKEACIKSLTEDYDKTIQENNSLQDLLDSERRDKDSLSKELQDCQQSLFTQGVELEMAKVQVSMTKDLQEQVTRLNKELLLMGEIQQKYQHKLTAMSLTSQPKPETQMINQALKIELKNTKAQLTKAQSELEGVQAYVHSLEDSEKTGDLIIVDLKHEAVQVMDIHKEQIQVLEDRYRALKMINRRQDEHILELTNELERKKSSGIKKKQTKDFTESPSQMVTENRPRGQHHTIQTPYNSHSPNLKEGTSPQSQSPQLATNSPGSGSAFSMYQPMETTQPSRSRSYASTPHSEHGLRETFSEADSTRYKAPPGGDIDSLLDYDDGSVETKSTSQSILNDSGYR